MATKKFINKVDDAVTESLMGLCSIYPHLDYHSAKRVILAPNWRNRGHKVAVVCGGGSGHEPFAAGFVGAGMMTAAVAGDVYAAPPPNHVLHALNSVSRNEGAGVLVVIPNYTGDRLNFGLAIEEAKQTGLKIASVVVADDCSIPVEEQGRAGKRGLVGLLYVNKIAGALAERGKTLNEVTETAQIVADNIATYGVGFTPCSLPGQGPMFKIPEDELEFGLGVHGEAGYKRTKWRNASEIVCFVLEEITKALKLKEGDDVAVIINNFGASSQLEQGIVAHEVFKQLKNKGIKVVRIYSGTLMSSLDSAGMHVSVLRLEEKYKNLFVECLDDKTDAPCWPGRAYSLPLEGVRAKDPEEPRKSTPIVGPKFEPQQRDLMKRCLANACEIIIKSEEMLNGLDRGCGDGDCGSTHKKLAEGILESLDSLQTFHPASALMELARIAQERMGGTSGAIYSLLFTAVANEMANCTGNEWISIWVRAGQQGIDSVMKYSGALPGDRTMLDALIPAYDALKENRDRPLREAIGRVAEAAKAGCEATKNMKPKIGRASYVKQAEFFNAVDAGSFGVAAWIKTIAETIANTSV